MANSMNRFSRPAIGCWLKHSPRKFTTTMLKVNFCKPVVANDWPAVPVAKNLVFAFNGIKTWWKTGLVAFHRADLAKHYRDAPGNGWWIPAYLMAILSARDRVRFGSVRQEGDHATIFKAIRRSLDTPVRTRSRPSLTGRGRPTTFECVSALPFC